MPNIKSAEKRVKIAERNRMRNIAERSKLKTVTKKFLNSVGSENSEEYLKDAIRTIDKAAAKGIIHKNAAARRKSRLTKILKEA